MENQFQYIVPEGVEGIRFIEFALIHIPTLKTRNGTKKAIKKGELLLNGEVVESGRFVNAGDLIEHRVIEAEPKRIFQLKIPVIYEDDWLAVINKPAGYGVSGNYFRTIENALPFNLKKSTQVDSLPFFKAVHRLDNQTSGLLIIAKTTETRIKLGEQFEKKQVQKIYHAIVHGEINGSGVMDEPIDEKPALTFYEPVKQVDSVKYKKLTLLKLKPQTGRTHQLRIHCSKMGNPILGDKLYSPETELFKGKGLFLAALALKFEHPISQRVLFFEMDLPHKFEALLAREQHRYDALNLL